MKSRFRVLGGIAAGCIGAGIVLGVIGLVISGQEVRSYRGDTETVQNQITQEVKKLKIDIDYGEVKIVEGTDFSIQAEDVRKDYFESVVKDGTWYVNDRSDKDNRINLFGMDISIDFPFRNWDGPEIILTVPKGTILEDLSIELGAGKAKAKHIDAVSAQLFVGAGQLEIDDLSASNADISCGAGDVSISGKVENQLSAECGIGKIELDLNGREDDYNYEINCGIGQIELNDRSFNFSTDRRILNPGAEKEISLDCGVGQIDFEIH